MGNQKKTQILESCLGKSQSLASLVEYATDSIVSKTILDKSTGTLTLFAFGAGQNLSEHTSPYDATIQVLDGQAEVIIDGQAIAVSCGHLIVMPANIPHSVHAREPFKMLLIMIRE